MQRKRKKKTEKEENILYGEEGKGGKYLQTENMFLRMKRITEGGKEEKYLENKTSQELRMLSRSLSVY